MDVSSLTAIDVHTHVHRSVGAGQDRAPGNEAMGAYFGIGSMPHYTVPELADYYRQRAMACVTFTIDSAARTGDEPVPDNTEIAELAAEHAPTSLTWTSSWPTRPSPGRTRHCR
ncbi:MAG TPA: hypothetical protein VHY31_24975 [Streptosporangiaceae bacterium]|jgi:hypothetical protein|nr:hypothetical protein [Streptosporangiaceae bacterium]